VAALREGDVGSDAFFDALERVAAIHANCRALLRRHHQRAGLELMDAMALYQEGAYERLCRWVQAQCRALGEADVPEVTPQLARATAALRARPLLHRYAAEEAATARHQALFGRFIAALTRGGPGGVPRAMEAHSHDPRRYIGDMCAWLHQACAGERELVAALLGDDEGRASQSEEADAAQLADAAWVLDRIFEGVCRPFKVRVEAALGGVPPTALLLVFQLHALLSFYTSTLASVAGRASVLTAAVAEGRIPVMPGFKCSDLPWLERNDWARHGVFDRRIIKYRGMCYPAPGGRSCTHAFAIGGYELDTLHGAAAADVVTLTAWDQAKSGGDANGLRNACPEYYA
jgi:hypothetical protein